MDKKSFLYKRLTVCLFLGIFLSIVLSMNYLVLDIDSNNLQEDLFRIFLNRLDTLFSGYGIVWSFVAFGIAVVLYKTMSYFIIKQSKVQIGLVLISIFFGFVNVAGLSMYYMDRLPLSVSLQYTIIFSFAAFGWAILFYITAYWIIEWINNIEANIECIFKEHNLDKKEQKSKEIINSFFCIADRHIFLTGFLVIFLCWLPWVIVYYPASMDNDVFSQLCSFLGYWKKSNNHPWFASSVIGICYKAGKALGSENVGIFLFVFIRNILMALIYAKCVEMIKNSGMKKYIYYTVLLFYAITPVWGAYAKHAFKDTFFAALFCLYIMCSIVLVQKLKKGDYKNRHFLEYGLSGLVASLFRNNCIYCVFPVTVLLVVYLMKKKIKWYQITMIIVCVGMYFGYNAYIFNFCGVNKGSPAEALSIPLQQTARAVKYHQSEITKEEEEVLRQVFEYDNLAVVYDPVLSDPVKKSIIKDGAVKYALDYLRVWLQMFKKYPVTYLEAACAQSYGYYAFTPKLPYGSGNMNSGMTIFNWLYGDGYENFSFHYNYKFEKARQTLL